MTHSTHSLRTLLLAGLTLCTLHVAQAADIKMPTDLPPYGPLHLPKAPAVQTEKLANGLTVWLVQQNNLPKTAVTLLVRGGYSADPPNARGLSDLLATTLKSGTSSLSARQIAERSEATGGDLMASAGSEQVELSIEPLAEHVSEALALLADIASHASFPEGEVALAKKNLLSDIQAKESEPRFLAQRAFGQIHYGDHPYGVVGPTSAMVEKATPESLRALYAAMVQPDQAILVVVGAIDPAAVLSAVHASFDGWHGTPSKAMSETPAPPEPAAEKKVFLVPRPDSVQTALLMGAPAPTRSDPDYAAVEVADAIYGGMFGSRLTLNIREDKGYTYSPYSFLTINHKAGTFFVREDVRNAVTGPSYKETLFELNRIATSPVSDQELTSAKRYLLGSLGSLLQSRSFVAKRLANLWNYGLDAQFIRKDADNIMYATTAQVQQASSKYMAPEKMTVVAVGEEKVVRDQFAPFNLPVVTAPKP